ncbi:MAG: glycosyltransferase family 39 protein [Vicinamibacterales bacterium]
MLYDYLADGGRLTRADPIDTRRLDALEWGLLSAIALHGAITRLSGLTLNGLWLDEILGVQGVGPEHGPLYYWTLRIAGSLPPVEFGARIIFALAGVAAIPLAYLVARRWAGVAAAVIAAGAMSLSPAHIYYSREARPYALLVTIWLLGVWILDRLEHTRWTYLWGAALALLLTAMPLTSANGAFFAVILVLQAIAACATLPRHSRLEPLGWLTLGSIASVVSYWILYRGVIAASSAPRTLAALDWSRFSELASALAVGFDQPTKVGPIAITLALLAGFGAMLAIGRRPARGLALAMGSVAGLLGPFVALSMTQHWLSVRYVLPALVPLILLAAVGAAALISVAVRAFPASFRRVAGMSASILLLVGLGVWQNANIERARLEKADWRRVARLLAERTHAGDLVVTSNDWTRLCLEFYLPIVGAQVRLENAAESIERAERLLEGHDVAFLVAGGFHTDPSIRSWMTSHYALFASPIEAISVSFFPDRAVYLQSRATRSDLETDRRYFWNTLRGEIEFDENSERFLLAGWDAAERDARGQAFRWVKGRSAILYVPAAQSPPASITLSLMPYPGFEDRQRLLIRQNGEKVLEQTLAAGWQDIQVPIQKTNWSAGANLFALEFSDAASPPGDSSRTLSVALSKLTTTVPLSP